MSTVDIDSLRSRDVSVGTEELVEAVEVSKRFPDGTQALDRVSISVRPGEVLGLVGPSGSGKSTLLLCLAGILTVDEGDIRYRGRSLRDMGERARADLRRSENGFVFQLGFLLDELTAAENVALPLRLAGRSRADSLERARQALSRVGVEELADKWPTDMSVGQAQRVAVARAVITEPAVIYADEPTGSLDSANGERVMDALIGCVRDTHSALVLVTHDAHIASFADRTAHIVDGRIESIT